MEFQSAMRVILLILGFLTALYLFLVGLKLMGEAFKTLGGCEAGVLFDFVNNPIAGLMVGILSTVLVQSSSTSTSIVVSLVGSGGMTVKQAIPVIMGANIGTTITSTLVACSQIRNKIEFERAFAAATVHDMFNLLSVLVFLPLEIIAHPLYHIATALVPSGTAQTGDKIKSPLDPLIKPLSNLFLQVNKKIITQAASGEIQCSQVDTILKGGMFYTRTSDEVAGAVSLTLSILFSVAALLSIVKILNILLLSTAQTAIKKALRRNGYIMMVIGAGVTFLVQSSSITTSVLTPMVGVDLIQIEQMFPLVLGANIGTTGTALIASMVSAKDEAVQIALCHLFFNIFGIIAWYPIPLLRQVPINMARFMGFVASKISWFPVAYILIVFVAIPAICVGISALFDTNSDVALVFGIILTVLIALLLLSFIYWLFRRNGKEKIMSWLNSRDVDSKTEVMEAGGETPVATDYNRD